MNFELTDEQQAIVDTTRTFTEKELIPQDRKSVCRERVYRGV
jgi:hypothetical protein